jgi:PHD/YefM family antitoxin component YafN of YafNO toxin-antitoxin module
MAKSKKIKESAASYAATTADFTHPVILEQEGKPMAVLLSVEDYERYQALLEGQERLSAAQAQQAADRVVFGDLVGCALASDIPIWVPEPTPLWRVPYRLFDGTLLAIVEVDAYSAAVSLTEQERAKLLAQVEQNVSANDVTT